MFLLLSLFLMARGGGFPGEKTSLPSLSSLLPKPAGWKQVEKPEEYYPENLFEYIDGAAEIYLSYDFKRLVVAQYGKQGSDASLTVEIYDMGNEKHAFGIYSIERFPESNFISLGNGAYIEDGVLNFIVSDYYVKLMCFECGDNPGDALELFAREIAKKAKDKKGLPQLLSFLPREGLVKNSEKFILRNFLGFGFLHDGYIAQYKQNGLEFECFIIEGRDGAEAQQMLSRHIEHYQKEKKPVQKTSSGYELKDPYYHNLYLTVVRNYICGVQRIKDGAEETGKKYLAMLVSGLSR